MRWSASDLSRYLTRRGLPPAAEVAPRRGRPKCAVGQMPQARLAALVEAAFPGRFTPEVGGLVPGRRFRADLCDVAARAVIECDGWESHGRHLAAFRKDRERDYLFLIAGYRILRIPAGLVLHDPQAVLERVTKFVAMLDGNGTRAGCLQ